MIKKLLFTSLFALPIFAFGQSVDITVGTSISDTTEVCNGASINVSATTSGISSITGYSWQISNGSNVTNASGSSFTFSPNSTGLYTINATVYGSDTVSETSYADVTTPLSNVTINSLGNINSQTLCYNSLPGNITSTVTGGGNNSTYTWEKKVGLGNWTAIGSNSQQLTDIVPLVENTLYRLVVASNALGCSSLTSNTLSFTVHSELTAPVVTSSQAICYNSSPISLSRTAASGGDGFYNYEWQQSVDNLTWQNISDTSANFSPGNLTQDTYYRIVVSDGCSNAPSNSVLIDVYDEIDAGLLSVADNQICYNTGTIVNINGSSGGDGVYSQIWEISSDGINFQIILGESGSSITTGNIISDKYYRVIVGSGCGLNDTSNMVLLEVADEFVAPPISYLGDSLICYDDTPASMSISPNGGRTPYNYVWEKKSSSSSAWNSIPNANTATFLELDGLAEKTDYRVLVTSSDGCGTLQSNILSIDVRDELTAPSISADQTICYNTNTNITRGNASGADGNYAYEWQYSTDNINFINIGAGSVSINTGDLIQSTYFRVKVSNILCGSEKFSNSSLVSVRDSLVPGNLSAIDDEICYASLTSLNVIGVSGADGNYTYQWQYQDSGVSNWSNIGSSTATISTGILNNDRTYRVLVNSGCNIQKTTPPIIVDVADEFTIGSIQNAGLDTICYDTRPSMLNITGNGGRAPYSYQWQKKPKAGTVWTNIGTNSPSYVESINLTESYEYRVILTSSDGCGSLVSAPYDIIVRPNVLPPILSNDVIICHNTSTTLNRGTASGANGEFVYEWFKSTNNFTYTSTGQSGSSLGTANLTSTAWYKVRFSNSLCSVTRYSDPVRVKVRDALSSGSLSANDEQICYNSATTLNLSNTTGADTNYSYSWQYNEGNTGWTSLVSNSVSIATPTHKNDVQYRVIVGSGCGVNDTTLELTLDVADSLIVADILNSGVDTICYNTLPPMLSINGSGGRTPYSYQWQRKPLLGSAWTNVGLNSSIFSESVPQTETIEYRALLTSDDGCGTLISNPYTVFVRPDLVAPSISFDTVICQNTGITISRGVASGADDSFTYLWQKSSDGVNFVNLPQTGPNYNTGNLTTTSWYRVQASNSLCSTSILSGAVRIKVRDSLSAGILSVLDDEICFNSSADLTVSGTTGADTNYSYEWQYNENGSGWNSFSNAITSVVSPVHKENVQYRSIVNSGCNVPDTTNVINVAVADSLLPGMISVFEDSVCYGSSPMQMSISGNSGGYIPYSYNWERRIGLTGSWFTVSNTGSSYQELDSILEDTYYRLAITSDQGCGTVTTPIQKFRVNALPGDDSWSILGPDEVCSGASGINYQLSSDYNTGTLLWSVNNASLSTNSLTKLFADFDDLGQLTNDTLEVTLTSNRTGCKRTIVKPLTLLEQSSPELAQIVQKTGTNILICSDTTQGVQYHWGYIPKSSGLVQLVPGATQRYHNFNASLDTSNNVYFVRTSYGTCHTFSYFGVSSNPLVIEENGFDIILYPNPTSEYINIESNTSPQRVWLSEASGRMIPLEPRNNRVKLPDQLPSGFYVLTLEIDGSLVQKKVIIDRR